MSREQVSGSDRVNIEKKFHQLYKDLTERATQNPETAPFIYMKDLFMWCVALGIREGKPRPLEGDIERGIFRWDQLSQEQDIPALKAIALAKTGDAEVLVQKERILRIAEEYANEGIRIIKREMVDQAGQPLWNLVNIVRSSN